MAQEQKKKVVILKEFRDKDDFAKVYKVDAEVEFEATRVEKLITLGLAKVAGEKSADNINNGPIKIDLAKIWQQVCSDVNKSEDLDDLRAALEAEKANDKPREYVVKALEARIGELSKTE